MSPAQQLLMFAPSLLVHPPFENPSDNGSGVVYTKEWVARFVLDLAGYTESANLVDARAIEPAAGDGAFLVEMAKRLIASCRRQNRPLTDCKDAIAAFELMDSSAATAQTRLFDTLRKLNVSPKTAEVLSNSWTTRGDYLLDYSTAGYADFVIGNPPYVRLEDLPADASKAYRQLYPTMTGRADLYIGFFEAALRQLKPGGACAFICADRWMLNQYGAELRRLITSGFAVETIVNMHEANAFLDDVSAYPAITVIRKSKQARVVVGRAHLDAEHHGPGDLTHAVEAVRIGRRNGNSAGLSITALDSWFAGAEPWPCASPARLALLRKLEDRFPILESGDTKVGIGVATGLDEVFLTKDPDLVEASRLLPLAMAKDTGGWGGTYLVNPWDTDGLVNLADFPRLKHYFETHKAALQQRHTARNQPAGWFKTIDRVHPSLTAKPKLYIPDIKDRFDPVLDRGETYPHHNLYFIQSGVWNLEVLGGLLLSKVAQLFIEAYGVRMRGGYLRFQAQYLRKIRLPEPAQLTAEQALRLTQAFRKRDREMATEAALEVYGIAASELKEIDE